MRPIIKVEGIGKRYRIGKRQSYRTLREALVESVNAPARSLASFLRHGRAASLASDQTHIWALNDVSFEVMPGDVMGIVGRNGAGKSTLLKILARITEPTRGRVELYGRVGSLLEVGTGFHPELTGRDNIFLSGAILGMRRAEIARKFDEIVAFAEIDQFIDTPVKHYSSGMYVRLAFAVAAHLDPEILLVDEVLAVGDVAFQKKCLGKIGDVASKGRTVLFVSHNMTAIESLCSSACVLDGGRVRLIAEPTQVVTEYTRSVLSTAGSRADLSTHSGRKLGAKAIMKEVEIYDEALEAGTVRMGGSLSVRVRFISPEPIRPCFGMTVKTDRGFRVVHVSDRFANQLSQCDPVKSGTVVCEVQRLPLMPGRYVLDLWLEDSAALAGLDMVADAASFEVVPADLLGTGRLPPVTEGPVFCHARWSIEEEDAEPAYADVFTDTIIG